MNAETRRRRGSANKPLGAAAAVDPAIEASAERAGIEGGPTEVADPVAVDAPVPTVDLPDAGTAVLPEPTLVAEPGDPTPIVTASPPLAAEPSAMDVVQAEAAADRVEAGIDPAVDPDGPHAAAAGQPMLTIERGVPIEETFGDFGVIALRDPDAIEHVRRTLSGAADPLPIGGRRVTVIEIVGPAQGRRRAGFAFGPEPRRFVGTQLTDAQLEAIRGDRLLTVGISEVSADLFGDPTEL